MLFTGFMVFAAGALILAKLKRRWLLRALNHDLALDLVVSGLTYALHFGTFSGLMAATVAGLLNSLATGVAKRLFGYIDGTVYYPGVFYVDPRA